MPKVYKNKKKHINPRYFLYESVEREDLIDDIRELSKEKFGSRDTYGDIDKLVELEMEELEEILQMLASKSAYDDPVDDREPMSPEEFTSKMLDTRLVKEEIEDLREFEYHGLTRKQRDERGKELGYKPGSDAYRETNALFGNPVPKGRTKDKGFSHRKTTHTGFGSGEGSIGEREALYMMSDDKLIKIYSLLKGQNIGPTKASAEALNILNTPGRFESDGRARLINMILDLRIQKEIK